MKIGRLVLLASLLGCFLTTTAFATVIDFSSLEFQPAHLLSHYSYTVPDDGLGLGIWSDTDDPVAEAELWWDDTDGFGIQSWVVSGDLGDRTDQHPASAPQIDEIEGPELLYLTFSSPVYITKIILHDLYYEDGYQEEGSYSFDDVDYIGFVADIDEDILDDTKYGYLEIFPDLTGPVQTVYFRAPGIVDGQDHEFSVKGIEYTSVPEPATLLLLGSGLALLALWGRRRTRVER